MLKELFDLVKHNAGDAVINNPDVPDDKNDAIVAEATNTVASGLRNIVAGGGAQNLLSLFGNKDKSSGSSLLSNPIVSMMIGHFAGKLMSKYNLGNSQANNISTSLIPNVLGSLINKSNDSGDSTFSLDNLLHSITGGKSSEVVNQRSGGGGLSDLLGNLTQSNGGGLMDIVGQLAGGAQQQQQRNGGGGLLDMISGFLK